MGYKYQKQVRRQRYGNRCMLCERVLQKKKQSYHHRRPKSCGGSASIENGAILCMQCQCIIHQFEYGTEAYEKLDNLIEKNMEKYKK
jgi:5-methylcytosine-specific restriction endonuclease McrA